LQGIVAFERRDFASRLADVHPSHFDLMRSDECDEVGQLAEAVLQAPGVNAPRTVAG
jgi:hypothetical protein